MSTWLRNREGQALAASAFVLLLTSVALALWWAPVDADQGFSQKIFYIHVPVALTAYACFAWGAWKALRLLWKGDERYDLESYSAVHIGVVFGILTLATGSIWAKISWGHWWRWEERQLVVFLILFLFYSAYFMLRFSIDAGPRRARISAVYALFGAVLIPISFLAVRLLGTLLHPTPLTDTDGPQMSGSMFFVFLLSFFGTMALAFALYHTELAGKRLDSRLKELRRALA